MDGGKIYTPAVLRWRKPWTKIVNLLRRKPLGYLLDQGGRVGVSKMGAWGAPQAALKKTKKLTNPARQTGLKLKETSFLAGEHSRNLLARQRIQHRRESNRECARWEGKRYLGSLGKGKD